MLDLLKTLYDSDRAEAHRFRYALLGFDLITICFVIVSSFFPGQIWIEWVDALIGLVIVCDFAARFAITKGKWRFWTQLTTLADLVAIASFLAPIAGEGLGFLRIMRTLRLLHTYQLVARLRADFAFFRRNQEVVLAAINLCVFLFVMTGFIYATQVRINPQIDNYSDALYFTVTTLTTTGFGDITPKGEWGRMLAVLIMIFGVTLFLRLAQVLFRPTKIRHECETCGLSLHDADAVHCKHCGTVVHIDTDGAV
ncbi:potassium channel family protein [Thioclava sp. BHET1]|uniref:Ion transporter n=1 Tax=Thioclava dalianensis TaxID=1185766 RepID=A0A074TI21_9RHOB|nr:potassium channel family protein [Thioclava dalianensis]KEP71361.1 ion transporter [Thioclava dalianensis]TMV90851.1 potassium channel family protein [Thioclava sp. BHET1]SFM78209.1 voltage-gated potassium channel [Thioclava dalianensis]